MDRLIEALIREFRSVSRADATLDGRLAAPPVEPSGLDGLRLIDQAALFIAPKTSYFLVSDLDHIGKVDGGLNASALLPLIGGPGAEAQVELEQDHIDGARILCRTAPAPGGAAR
jgi:hypothetical protein